MSLTVKAYAKLNLWLDITGCRGDGYHTINTVMRRIDLYDDVEVETCSGSDVTVRCSSPDVPSDEWNIAYRAAREFMSRSGKNIGVNIGIHKRIPVGAGLGGSSADGAAVLTALNELCGRRFGDDELCALGARLGADVPFCITGGTARCTGIGEIMQPIGCADFAALIAVPDFACSTAKAYQRYDASPIPERPGFDAFCGGIGPDSSFLSRNMYNIFEKLYNDSRINALKDDLLALGAVGACMSGSGSAVFGIFPDIESARTASTGIKTETKFIVNAI
jgi:4-diphosphocytidyl-2-C-methyl-D-erythritol kinase